MSVRGVYHLNCATMCPFAGFLLGQKGWRGHMVAHCLLVETERDGLVLVDTGFGTIDCEGRSGLGRGSRAMLGGRFDLGETAVAQVQTLGYRPEDVRHVVVTHLDLDHAGGISDFPHAKVHLHAKEHAAAIARSTFMEKNRYLAAHWRHGPSWEVYVEDGDTWRGLPAIARLRGIDADIGLVPLHGHTRGHSAVIVKGANDRWLVHAGDAYFHRHAMEGGTVPVGFRAFERLTQTIPAQRRASAAALRQLRASYDDLDIFCAHDPVEYAHRVKHAVRPPQRFVSVAT